MVVVYNLYKKDDLISINDFVKNKKLTKYYNRETMAAMLTVGQLMKQISYSSETPIYYSTGIVEHEEYELDKIAALSANEHQQFDTHLFIEKGMSAISPLTQFKVLYNMTLCFISIEHGLKGENAAMYSSASGLLISALFASTNQSRIIGAGKMHADATVESGFAFISKNEIESLPYLSSGVDAIEIFRFLNLKNQAVCQG